MGRSAREIKELLRAHNIDFSHCVEKYDLEMLLCEVEGKKAPPRPEFAGSIQKPLTEVQHRKDWFHELFGFTETGLAYEEVQARLSLRQDDATDCLTAQGPNGVEYRIGQFSTPSLGELRESTMGSGVAHALPGRVRVVNAVGDVAALHADPANRHSTFQVASQFNCLEFLTPDSSPESGVGRYVSDRTQGAACSIACGPATAFRNYLVNIEGAIGQRHDRQVNNLHQLLKKLGCEPTIDVKAGYTLASDEALQEINSHLERLDSNALDGLRAELRIGVQNDAQVTSTDWGKRRILDTTQTVTQIFCSACSVSYSGNSKELWAPFASLVLSAAYEATLWAALCNAVRHRGLAGSRRVFLTCLGGAAFGNTEEWIVAAMKDALTKFEHVGLEVYLVRLGGKASAGLLSLEELFPGSDTSVDR